MRRSTRAARQRPAAELAVVADLWLRSLRTAIHTRGRPYAATTIAAYHDALMPFVHWGSDRDIADLTADLIHRHYAAMHAAGARPQYLQQRDKVLRLFLAWCVERKLLDRSPLAGERRLTAADPPVTAFTNDEFRRMLRACDDGTWWGLRGISVITTLWYTGIRRSELCRLDLADYDGQRRTLHVPGTKSVAADRVVGVPDELALALDEWVALARGREPGPLFLTERRVRAGDDRLTSGAVQSLLWRLRRRSGVADLRAHRFRHTFACAFLRAGGDLYHLARILGHSRVDMTSRYLRAIQAEQVAAEHVRVMRGRR